jgi:hypothetical protein
MSHLSQEDLDAVKGGYAEHKQYFLDAINAADKLVPDILINPRSSSGLPNKLDFFASSDELFKLAKAIESVAETRKWFEKWEKRMKDAGLGDQL